MIMFLDVIFTFFTALPKETKLMLSNDSHDDPEIRKRERQGNNIQIALPGPKSQKVKRGKNSRKKDHPVCDFRFSLVAKRYLKTSFLIDILACLPILVFESIDLFKYDENTRIKYAASSTYMYLTLLSLLRLFMLSKVMNSVLLVINFLKERETRKLIFIENCKSIIFALYKTLFLIHIAACIWIYIKYHEGNVDESFIEAERALKYKHYFNFDTIDDLRKKL